MYRSRLCLVKLVILAACPGVGAAACGNDGGDASDGGDVSGVQTRAAPRHRPAARSPRPPPARLPRPPARRRQRIRSVPTTGANVFKFTNHSTSGEWHELMVLRKNDGVTKSFDQILSLPENERRDRPR